MRSHFKRIQASFWLLPVLYVGFIFLTVLRIYSEPLLAHTQEPAATTKPSRDDTASDTLRNAEKEELDRLKTNVEKRSDDLQRLISQLTLGNAVYTALLGLLAYFGLKEAKGDADRLIQNNKDALAEKTAQFEAMKNEFSDFKNEVREDIPGLIEMQKGLRAVLSHIRMEVDMSNLWVGGEGAASYNNLSEEQRQKVILAEMATSSLDYFRLLAANKTVAAEIYDGLTDFYAARAKAMNNNAADLSRAFIYIDRACDSDPMNPIHFSRRGALVLAEYSDGPFGRQTSKLDKARVDFDRALSFDPNHPSSLYNLAWIMDEKGHFEKAIELLDRLIEQREQLPSNLRGRRIVNAYVNRACARSKQLQLTINQDGILPPRSLEKLRKVLDDCVSAEAEAQAYNQISRFQGDMKREWGLGGELAGLHASLTDEQSGVVRRIAGI